MPTPTFNYHPLKLVNPSFQSPLVDLVTELDHLRKKKLFGSTNPSVLFQLKYLFHMFESIGSARIEGNNTTVAEYVDTKIEEEADKKPGIKEIQNLEATMDFIEENIANTQINKAFISELHRRIVHDLPATKNGEGDKTPGKYRRGNLEISKSNHRPPDYLHVDEYMDELFSFINTEHSPKYDLLNVALAHHRFVWVHPFNNGNGRTVRMFTYAMLVKLGFNVAEGRILNPTAVFCNDRNKYYEHLSYADTGTDEGIEKWCLYVLKGLKDEIEKIDLLLDYDFLKQKILLPAIAFSFERKLITDNETKILKLAAEKQIIQAGDLKTIYAGKHSSEISRQISKLVSKKMLQPLKKSPRKYSMYFANNYLLRGVVQALADNGFLAVRE